MARRQEVKKEHLEELVDEMIAECENPKDLLGRDGLVKQMTKRLVERMLQAGHLKIAPLFEAVRVRYVDE